MSSLGVTAVTAHSPVGLDVAQTCAAIRAGVSGLREHPYHDLATKEPDWDPDEELVAALVPDIDPWMDAPQRLLELALGVLRDIVRTAGMRRAQLARTALLLALPQKTDPVVAHWELEAWFAEQLCRRAGIAGFATVRHNQSGHVGVLELLAEGKGLLATRGIDHCLVVAADSYHHEGRLELLDQRFRLRSHRSPDGFIPGEAAVALLLELDNPLRPALATVTDVTFADEPRALDGDYASSGRGLQHCIEALRGDQPAPWVLCDLNGESYRAFEWGTVLTRLSNVLGGVNKLVHPADCIGDTGAASGGILLACVVEAWRRGYAPAREALVFTASESGRRAAALLRAPS